MEQHEVNPKEYVREVTAKYIGPRRKAVKIGGPEDAAKFISSVLRDHAREHFVALYLDGAHNVASYSVVSTGSANSAPVHPREVFQGAVLVGACALVVGHNHPSGELRPSDEDRAVTKRLCEAGKLLGVSLLDHIIVSNQGYYSFQEMGAMLLP